MKTPALLIFLMFGHCTIIHAQCRFTKRFCPGYSMPGLPVQSFQANLYKPEYLDILSLAENGDMQVTSINNQYYIAKIRLPHHRNFITERSIEDSLMRVNNIRFLLGYHGIASNHTAYYFGSMFKWLRSPGIRITSQKTLVCTSNKGWKKVISITLALPVNGYTLANY